MITDTHWLGQSIFGNWLTRKRTAQGNNNIPTSSKTIVPLQNCHFQHRTCPKTVSVYLLLQPFAMRGSAPERPPCAHSWKSMYKNYNPKLPIFDRNLLDNFRQ